MEIVLGIILLVAAVFLTVAVLMQSGKSYNLSGAIAGGAETFFGKTKGKAIDKVLSKITTIVSIVFVVIVLIVYIIQPDSTIDYDKWLENYLASSDTTETTAETDGTETTAEASDTTAGDEAIFEETTAGE